jgi:hypothetical protein
MIVFQDVDKLIAKSTKSSVILLTFYQIEKPEPKPISSGFLQR